MEILQPYNNDTLQLISDNTDYIFTESDLQNGKIKISVFSDVNTFLQSEDLQENIDFYVKNDELFLKPNEFLDRNGFSENNYNFNLSNMKILTPSNKEYNYNASKSEKSFKFKELGFYQFLNNNKYIASNINYDEFSTEEASTFLTKKGINIINDYDNIYDIIDSQKQGFELWRYILFILIFLFLIEFFLSNFYIKNE